MEEAKQTTYETNSYWDRVDITTRTYFDVLYDFEPKRLLSIIQEPMVYNQEIRTISRRLYSSNGIVRNTIDYIQSLPSLDYVVTNYTKSANSKVQKEIMNYVLKKIKHKEFVSDALSKGCIDGTAIYYFDISDVKSDKRKTIDKFTAENITEINTLKPKLASINASIKSLPIDYCRIIGIKNNSYVVSFDLTYFDADIERTEEKLRRYPAEFRKAHDAWRNGNGKQMLILDNKKTIVHKISSNLDEPWGRPLVTSAISDILYSDYFTNTKRNVLDNINNKIIYETFPEGKTAGTSALSQQQQKEQHNAVKTAVQNKSMVGGVSFFSVAAGTKIGEIEVKTDIFDNDYESNLDTKIGTDLGFAASLLNASGTTSFSAQQTNLELVTAQIMRWIENIANELNKVINYNILGLNYIDVEVNYLPITHLNRDKYFKNAKDLLTIGRGTLSYLANCAGLSKEVYFSMLDEQLEEGVLEKYPVIPTSYNTSGNAKEDTGGRPSNDSPTNENTIRSKTNNSNNVPKPSV